MPRQDVAALQQGPADMGTVQKFGPPSHASKLAAAQQTSKALVPDAEACRRRFNGNKQTFEQAHASVRVGEAIVIVSWTMKFDF